MRHPSLFNLFDHFCSFCRCQITGELSGDVSFIPFHVENYNGLRSWRPSALDSQVSFFQLQLCGPLFGPFEDASARQIAQTLHHYASPIKRWARGPWAWRHIFPVIFAKSITRPPKELPWAATIVYVSQEDASEVGNRLHQKFEGLQYQVVEIRRDKHGALKVGLSPYFLRQCSLTTQ